MSVTESSESENEEDELEDEKVKSDFVRDGSGSSYSRSSAANSRSNLEYHVPNMTILKNFLRYNYCRIQYHGFHNNIVLLSHP